MVLTFDDMAGFVPAPYLRIPISLLCFGVGAKVD